MSDFVQRAGYVFVESTSTITPATTTANTKGAWSQMVAATASRWDAIQVWHYGDDAAGFQLLDIGVGGSGSEQVVVPDLAKWDSAVSQGVHYSLIPVSIPAGSRVAARCATSASNQASALTLSAYARAMETPESSVILTTEGIDTANSRGTGTTPSGSPSWVQIVASTARSYHGFFLQCVSANSNQIMVYDLEVGIGGSGSEVVIFKALGLIYRNFVVVSGSIPSTSYINQINVPVAIPAGTRIAVRCTLTFQSGGAVPVYFSTMGY